MAWSTKRPEHLLLLWSLIFPTAVSQYLNNIKSYLLWWVTCGGAPVAAGCLGLEGLCLDVFGWP